MGLKISNFQQNGQDFANAYAKVKNIAYNNDSKIATYDIVVFPTKGSLNKICKLQSVWIKVEAGSDIVAQCYNKTVVSIGQVKNRIASLNIEIESASTDSQRYRLEAELNRLLTSDIIKLDGAEEW